MDKAQRAQAQELHRTLEYIGLRAQATTVGLIQLCAELVKAGVLDDGAIENIKDSIHRELTVSHSRTHGRVEFEEVLKQRLDAIFPQAGSSERRAKVGTLRDMETALDHSEDSPRSTHD